MYVAPAVIQVKVDKQFISLSVSTTCTINLIQFMIRVLFITASTNYEVLN